MTAAIPLPLQHAAPVLDGSYGTECVKRFARRINEMLNISKRSSGAVETKTAAGNEHYDDVAPVMRADEACISISSGIYPSVIVEVQIHTLLVELRNIYSHRVLLRFVVKICGQPTNAEQNLALVRKLLVRYTDPISWSWQLI
jgi:hypothetical protein